MSLAADYAAGYARDASSQPFTMSRPRLVGPPRRSPRPRLFKECSARRGRLVAAPHSCRLSDDNAFVDWRTLGQTCSRGDPGSAICVQRLDDSLNSAIRATAQPILADSSAAPNRMPAAHLYRTERTTQTLII